MKGDMNTVMWFIILLILVVLMVALFYFYGYNSFKALIQQRILGQ